MEPDLERPYSGHKIDVSAVLSLERVGHCAIRAPDYRVLGAKLDYNW
jgi:hypothetical protein